MRWRCRSAGRSLVGRRCGRTAGSRARPAGDPGPPSSISRFSAALSTLQHRFGALGVAPEPEQVLGRAATAGRGRCAADGPGRSGGSGCWASSHRRVLAQHPEILRADAVRQADGRRLPAIAGRGRRGAHGSRRRRRRRRRASPNAPAAEPLPSKLGVVGSGLGRSASQRCPSRARKRRRASSSASIGRGSTRSPVSPGSCRAVTPADAPIGFLQHPLLRRCVTEPERLGLAQDRRLAEQRLGECAGEGGKSAVLQHAGAEAVGENGAPEPGRLHEAGACRRRAVRQVQGIGEPAADLANARGRPAAGLPASSDRAARRAR